MLAEDPETGEQGYFEVVAVTNHLEDEILHVTLDTADEPDLTAAQTAATTVDSETSTDDNDTQQTNNPTSQPPTPNS